MIAAHNLVTTDEEHPEAPETDGYFTRIEQILGLVRPATPPPPPPPADNPLSAAAKPVQGRSAPPSAPVNSGGNGKRPTTMRLTADEVEMAEMMGMTKEEYARNKLALEREGKIGAKPH